MNTYTYSGGTADPEHSNHRTSESTDNRPDSRNSGNLRASRNQPSQKGKRKKSDPQLPESVEKTVSFFKQRSTRVVLGSLLILFAVYLVAISFSFLKNYSKDQSKILQKEQTEQTQTVSQPVVDNSSLPQLTDTGINNAGGPAGASLTHKVFVKGFGLGAFVLIVYIVVLALSLLDAIEIRFWSLTMKTLLLTVTISFVVGLITFNSHAAIPLGGNHGHYANLFLINNIGWIGAICVNAALIVIVAALFINEIMNIYNVSREKLRILKAKAQHEEDKQHAIKQEIEESLSDGPMSDKDHDADDDNANHHEGGNISIEINDPALEDTTGGDSQSKIDNEKVDDTNHPGLDSIEEIDEMGGEKIPDFEINEVVDIEQADSNENEAYKIQGPYDPRADLSDYKFPTLDLLEERERNTNNVDIDEQEANKLKITNVLHTYGIEIVKIEATIGPTVTLYKIVPAEGVRIAKIKRLEDDIAMSLAALGIRIIAPIPGESNIGIEVPNRDPQVVSIRSILGSKAFQECRYALPMALGATIDNEVFITDLAKMPHLLVAGATGQGKSVGLNTIIASLIYKRHPAELKFVLIDPKQVEFSLYSSLENHYLAKLPDAAEAIVTKVEKAVDTLNSLCVEMEDRYSLLKDAGCRSLSEYNEKFIHRRLNPERGHRFLPYIVMIVDEFADIIMQAGKSIELPIARIAQKARAVGMHLIIATQRPSTNVITGMIKANFPGRMAFAVRQRVDSQTILDCTGANQLIGRGDMLISANGGALQRVQCAFIDTKEVEAICKYIEDQRGYPVAYILPEPPVDASDASASVSIGDRDQLFEEVARMVVQSNTASTSNIQRKYSVGYARAGKIMDQLEAAGIVGPSQGGRPRQVLMSPADLEMYLAN